MATTIRTVKLPDGNLQKVKVPEEWGASEIREALIKNGVIAGSAAAATPETPAPVEEDMPPFVDPEPESQEPRAPSLGERFVRQQGLGIRNVVEGAAGFPLLVGDAANSLLNFIPGVELQKPSRVVHEGLTEAGLPVPETRAERMAAATQHAAAGTVAGISAAKGVVTPFTDALTSQAGIQTVAGTAAGVGFGAAGEADLGPVGQIVVGLGAALAGAKGATSISNRFGRYMDNRVQVGPRKEITPEEVRTELEADGTVLGKDSDELRVLTEQLNELRVQQRVADETAQFAAKSTDTLEQAHFKRREREKRGTGSSEVPVHVRRAQETLRRKDIEAVEAKIRAEEEAAARATPEVKQAEAIRSNGERQANEAVATAQVRQGEIATPSMATRTDRGVIHGDSTVPRDVTGRLKWIDRFGNDLIGRVEKIAPQMAIAVRRVTQRSATRTNSDVQRINEFYDSREYKALPRGERTELDRALLNSDYDKVRSITSRVPGLTELYESRVRSLLLGMSKNRIAKGADGFIEDFHPRVVRNVKKLRAAAGRNQRTGNMDEALAAAERESMKKKGRGLDEREVAAIINQSIGGRPLRVLKDRRINEIPAEHQKYYETSKNSLIDYIHKYHSDDATREFFKSSLGKEIDFGVQGVNQNTIGELMAASIRQRGGLTEQSAGELAELLSVHFGVGRMGVGAFQRNAKNIFTTGTLVNPISTVTQFGDLAPVMSKFGVFNSLAHLNPLRSKAKDLTVYDIGVRELSRDARTARGTAKIVKAGLKSVGFDGLDKIMANTAVNAAFKKWTRMAQKNRHRTKRELQRLFGDETEALVKDLQAHRLTDNVKTLMLHEVGDIRPVSREDMPVEYNMNPNGRWKYSLLSWTLKQMNHVRNNAQNNWREGRRLKGVKEIATLAMMMGLTNGSVLTVKDFLMGRDIDPASNLVSGMLALGMSGKYVVDALQSNRGGEALGAIIPYIGIGANAVQKTFNAVSEGDPLEMLNATPSSRNLSNLITGDLIPAVGSAANAVGSYVIPDAEPGTTPVERNVRPEVGMPAKVVPTEEFSFIKHEENGVKAGYDESTKLWRPHASFEGGTDTLGYGHKLTKPEAKSGKVRIGDRMEEYGKGLTEAQVLELLRQDTAEARRGVLSLVKVPLAGHEMEAILSLAYNVGWRALKGTDALAALNAGDRAGFAHHAFNPKTGFINVNGKPSPVLIGRRARERKIWEGKR